ncbi:hypothetical protein BFP70_16365 [Thioclava sp. SK-1]|uniref:AraC family transcriptional regulator n=1 Tax=Thioclava sp. SK-1 TaxID=1889770 RepID=UPI000826E187|nr:GyrI-like domain-containing protein [Thioclava sp. SK-1]OCX61028.1 hypothetical protein BFP70_16365 [Thioclava sp. SK-1]
MISEVTIHELPKVRLVGLLHRGAYAKLGDTFDRLSAMFEEGALWSYVSDAAAIGHDNPRVTPVDQLRAHACFVVTNEFPMQAPLEEHVYPAGRYAVMEVKGSYDLLSDAYRMLFEEWYPSSGETYRGPAAYEVYLNDPSQVAENDLLTEIRIPLAGGTDAG